jgi:long-chain fatty acid transport protein
MSKSFISRILLILTTVTVSNSAMASAFQLWEQDAATMGNYHAGFAAAAEDASTAFYNPAGLVRIKNQEMIAGGIAILPDLRFQGTVATNTLTNTAPQSLTAQGDKYGFTPFLHYAAPISEKVVFGLSYTRPFGFKTDYGSNTLLRYVSVLNTVDVFDLSPSLGVLVTDKISLGAGINFQRLASHFQREVTAPGQVLDTLSTSGGNDHGLGYHLGILYQFSEKTRVGLSYISKVVHAISGSSNLMGPLVAGDAYNSQAFKARIILPPITSLSVFHSFNSNWDLMGNISCTQWSTTRGLVLNNVVGMQSGVVNPYLQMTLSNSYRNTWNYSLGANYHVNEKFLIRTGLGFDQSVTQNGYTSVQLPDSNRVALALGGHYQATETIGIDLGWVHTFATTTNINNLSQMVGSQTTVTNGVVDGNTDTYGLQVKWDIL